ncbi:unnamed protein product [Menidia menidia]|uniref:(Atlantic silverside) hypothetical protein n=1 Tax=Menidia menidia TaxID=238744 RepID=A0A8S4AZC9_9TELE|nr:unnamed protein product [Menidia menidia]
MAQKGVQLDTETFSCSICLDVLKDPVTIPCGHSYCMSCIKAHFDGEDQKRVHSCPQCRKHFTPRPVLEKSTMLAALVEQLKKTGLQAAPADHCYAGPEDVACDVCSGRQLRARKSCLSCVASYCEEHLHPHYDSPTFKKHKLVEPSKKLQENICSVHDEVKKLFCRTDQKSICSLCSVEEHKGHHTVSAAAERTERQRELEGRRQQIQQRIQDTQKDVDLLQQEVEAIDQSADKTLKDSKKMFTQLIHFILKKHSVVEQQVRSQQQTAVRGVKELQQELQQEITELQRKDAELQQLSHTEDHIQFLTSCPSLPALGESTHSSSIRERPLSCFEDVTAAVSELKDKLQHILTQDWTKPLRPCLSAAAEQNVPPPSGGQKKRVVFADSRGLALTAIHLFSPGEDEPGRLAPPPLAPPPREEAEPLQFELEAADLRWQPEEVWGCRSPDLNPKELDSKGPAGGRALTQILTRSLSRRTEQIPLIRSPEGQHTKTDLLV